MMDTKALLAVVLSVTAFVTSVPAAADPPIGTRIERGTGGLTGAHSTRRNQSPRPGINAYFRCMASLDRTGAARVLAHEYMSGEQTAEIGRVVPRFSQSVDRREDCFSGFGGRGVEMRYDPVSAIGGFAEFFIDRDFDVEDASDLGVLPREDWQNTALIPRNGSEMIGLCTAHAAGPEVYRLLESTPASDDETAAIQAVVPFLGPCLTEGVEASFDATSLRALLAHSLYKALTGMEALKKAKS